MVMLKMAAEKLGLMRHASHRIPDDAHAVVDLDGAATAGVGRVAEAIAYRLFDQTFSRRERRLTRLELGRRPASWGGLSCNHIVIPPPNPVVNVPGPLHWG
jgi:hypothetical protein